MFEQEEIKTTLRETLEMPQITTHQVHALLGGVGLQ
jgi:hypothetical protein